MADLKPESTDLALMDYERLQEDCGLIDLSTFEVIQLQGSDRKGWLQGQVTNDVRELEPGRSRSFCFCSATGQIVAVVDAWALPDSIVMICPEASAAAVRQRIVDMVILEDVEAPALGSHVLVSLQGRSASRRLGELVKLPELDAGEVELEGSKFWCLRSPRTSFGGWDLCFAGPDDVALARLRELFPTIDHGAYDIARLEAGVPSLGSDIGAKTMPPELGPAFESRHVSYRKGCYMGQEVLMRIHSRGHTNKSWVGLLTDGPVEPGAVITAGPGKEVGSVTSAAYSPRLGHFAAGMVRNEAALAGTSVEIVSERGNVFAEVRPFPLL